MAIARVQAANAGTTAAVASVAATLGATPTNGNLLVALHHARAASPLTPAGWNLGPQQSTNDGGKETMFWKVAASDSATLTVTLAASATGKQTLIVAEYNGFTAAPTIDKSTGGNSGATSVASQSTGTTATTTAADEVAIAAIGLEGTGATSPSWTNSFGALANINSTGGTGASNSQHVSQEKFLSATGTVETTMSWTNTRIAAAVVATFKAGAGAQTCSPTAIGTAETFGTPVGTPTVTGSPGGVGTAEALGTPVMSGTITCSPTGIPDGGGASPDPHVFYVLGVGPTAIPTATAFGAVTATPTVTASPTGIATGEAFGVPTGPVFGTNQTVNPGWIRPPRVPPASGIAATPATLQSLITANPTGSVFLLGDGNYLSTYTLKNDIQLWGGRGAVFDGVNTRSVPFTNYASVTGVGIYGMKFTRYTGASLQIGSRWLAGWNEVSFGGVSAGGTGSSCLKFDNAVGAVIFDNDVHHGWVYGITGPDSSDCLVEGNDVHDNNQGSFDADADGDGGGSKFARTTRLSVRYNRYAQNFGAGIWLDIDNEDYVVEYNLCDSNEAWGIAVEISWRGIVRNNTLRNNGARQIFIRESGGLSTDVIDVSFNEIEDGPGSMICIGQEDRGTSGKFPARGNYICRNIKILNNTIVGTGDMVEVFQAGTNETPYANGNVWDSNHYHTDNLADTAWKSQGAKNWTTWHNPAGYNRDPSGDAAADAVTFVRPAAPALIRPGDFGVPTASFALTASPTGIITAETFGTPVGPTGGPPQTASPFAIPPPGDLAEVVTGGFHGGGGFNLCAPDPVTPGRWMLGTDVGGPSRTLDFGADWTPIKTGLLTRVESGFATLWQDPADHNHLLALAGAESNPDDFGSGGIYETFNYGGLWTRRSVDVCGAANGNLPVESGGPRSVDKSLVVKIGSTYYAGSFGTATKPGGIYSSTTLTSWAAHSLAASYIRCLVLDPSNPSAMLAGLAFKTGASFAWGVYRVTTAGVATPIRTGLPSNTTVESIVTCPTCNRWYASCGINGIFVSTDNGASWAAGGALPGVGTSKWAPFDLKHNAGTGQDVILIGCHNPALISGVKFASLAYSNDGAATFVSRVTNIDPSMFPDGATWWESLDSFGATKMLGASGSAVHDVRWDPHHPGWAMIATQGGPWVTQDEGVHWQAAPRHSTITKNSIAVINPVNPDLMMMNSDDWAGVRSSDRMTTIEQFKPNSIPDIFGISIASDGAAYYLSAGRLAARAILKGTHTTPPGSWTNLSCPFAQDGRAIIDGFDGTGREIVLVGTTEGLWRRAWNGSAFVWTKVVTTSFTRFTWPGDRRGTVVYATTTSAVWKSIDAGVTWFVFWTTSLPSLQGFDCDDQGHLWVGIASALVRIGAPPGVRADIVNSTDTVDSGGVSQLTTSMQLSGLAVEWKHTALYVTTPPVLGVGASLKMSTDLGVNFTDISTDSFRAGVVAALSVAVSGSVLFIGTDGQAAYVSGGQSFGAPTATITTATSSPTGIGSAEAFGTPVRTASVVCGPTGIPTQETFGTPVRSSTMTASPTGIPSAEVVGNPNVSLVGSYFPTTIASAEAFGNPTAGGLLTASPSGIGTAEATGSPSVSYVLTVSPSSIPSAESFGIPSADIQGITVGFVELDATHSPLTTLLPTAAERTRLRVRMSGR